ncbi:MAG: hypothetical protein IJU37_05650 [Desulfovibrio sp.]|nr:hypothetical protein [Desulfovibrio sp.]
MDERANDILKASILIDDVKAVLDVVIAAFSLDNIGDKDSNPPVLGVPTILTDCKTRLERSQGLLNP